MATSDIDLKKETLLKTFYTEQANCALKGMLMSLFAELFEEDILIGDISAFMADYFNDYSMEPDTQTAMEIIEEAEEIFKREHSHSRWLRKAQLFRQCVKKFKTLHTDLMLDVFGIDHSDCDEETDETL